MSTRQPSYLKLHHDPTGLDAQSSSPTATWSQDRPMAGSGVDLLDNGQEVVEGFWRTYSEITGWRIDTAHAGGAAAAEQSDEQSTQSMNASDAQRLADAAQAIAEQLQQQQQTMRLQQAELAARAAVILDPSQANASCDAMDRLLGNATLATGTEAAVIYLLDENTERLCTRFVFGLSPEKRLGTSRPLRGARGDLEAMVQGILVMERFHSGPIDLAAPPEPFPSGICVCLGDIELPIGTMWLFSPVVNSYPDSAAASARIAAAHVCQLLASLGQPSHPPTQFPLHVAGPPATDLVDAELERILAIDLDLDDAEPENVKEMNDNLGLDFDATGFVEAMEPLRGSPGLAPAPVPPSVTDWTNQIVDWQHDTLPLGERLAPRWTVDGMVESPLSITQSWHHWDVLPDGVIAVAMCQFGNRESRAGNMLNLLDATVSRAALQAHAAYRHTPQDAITRVMHTLLQVRDDAIDESGRPSVSLFYAHVDPESGRARISSIGDWSSLVISRYGYRPVSLSQSNNVRASEMMSRQAGLNQETTLLRGEVLVVGGAQWMGLADDIATAEFPQPNRHESAQNRIGTTIKEAMSEGERSPLAALRRMTATLPLRQERSAISLLHSADR